MFISEIQENFLHSLPSSEGEIFEWTHPEKGLRKQDLKTHVWLRRGDPRRLLISISGVHGAEAFIGSLIQQKIIKERSLLNRENPPTLLFIHNLNSFGSAWVRRTNHQNIDLNRNCWNEIPSNSNFASYVDWLSSKSSAEFWMQFLAALPAVAKNGIRETSGAIAKGQSLFPDSLFFAGTEQSFEIRQLQNFLLQHFTKILPEKILILDIHTGLGSFTHESLLLEPTTATQLAGEVTRQFQAKLIDPANEKGFYPAIGTLGSLFHRVFPQSRTCHITQEFGTYSFMSVLRHMVLENSMWRDKGLQASGREDLLLETFFPRSQSWRDAVVQLGVSRFRQLDNFI